MISPSYAVESRTEISTLPQPRRVATQHQALTRRAPCRLATLGHGSKSRGVLSAIDEGCLVRHADEDHWNTHSPIAGLRGRQ